MIKLRWYQEKATKLLFDYWRRTPDKHPIIAIPTGAGKSLIIADIIYQVYSKKRIEILILSHRKEILSQNKNAAEQYLKEKGLSAEIGIYSAGLGEKNKKDITIAGIQSIYRKADLFQNVRLIIIDEVHLIPPSDKSETMYQTFINSLPDVKCVGLTATPYRLGSGYIVGKDHLFDEIIFDLTSRALFNRLIREKYLTNLVSERTECELDADGVKTIAGDYFEKELALKFDRENITRAAISEIVRKASAYKKWLIFAINIDHAEHIVEELNTHDISAAPVHSKMWMDRGAVLQAFREGKIRALVNVNILTTGIDVPDIDLIVMLRPTKSPVLYVQSVGRGLRISPGKDHCLVLDFARVIQTLGPINNVRVHKKRKGKSGEPVVKACPQCNKLHPPITKICDRCGYEFQFKIGICPESSDATIIALTNKRKYKVSDVFYKKHDKRNAPSSLKVTYLCGLETFSEWVCIEHQGFAKHIANNWLKNRLNGNEIPSTVKEALALSNNFLKPDEIIVKKEGKYPEIIDYKFKEHENLTQIGT